MIQKFWQAFLKWLDSQIFLLNMENDTPLPPPPAPEPIPAIDPEVHYLTLLCEGMKTYEGWYPGSRSYRNNNPGNCKYSSVGYLPIYQPVKRDKDNFAIFKDVATGSLYHRNLLKSKAKEHPTW